MLSICKNVKRSNVLNRDIHFGEVWITVYQHRLEQLVDAHITHLLLPSKHTFTKTYKANDYHKIQQIKQVRTKIEQVH